MSDDLVVRPLDKSHGLGAFSCGNDKIDNYLKRTAWKEHKSYKIRVFVGTRADAFDAVGHYSFTFMAWVPENISPEIAKKFDVRFGTAVPAIYLAKLGVTESEANKGYGRQLMRDAFNRSLAIANNASVSTLTLDAIDQDKAAYYEKLGFQRFSPGDLRMAISLATLRLA